MEGSLLHVYTFTAQVISSHYVQFFTYRIVRPFIIPFSLTNSTYVITTKHQGTVCCQDDLKLQQHGDDQCTFNSNWL